MSAKRVIHQEYLQMWLNGEELEIKTFDEWTPYSVMTRGLYAFNREVYEFRKKPKLVKVDIEAFKDCLHYTAYSSFVANDMIDLLSKCIVEE